MRLSGLGCEVDAAVVEAADVAGRLLKCAASLDADLIVMGARGLAARAGRPLGGVAERMLRRAPPAVLTVRADDDESASLPQPSLASSRSQIDASAAESSRQPATKSGHEGPNGGGAPTIQTPRPSSAA